MNPIIVIGMDNTGKTTLVEGLKKAYNDYASGIQDRKAILPEELQGEIDRISQTSAEVIKSPGPLNRKDMYKWCDTQIKRFGADPDKLVIYDRFGAIDEQIYAPIVRGMNQLDHVEYLLEDMVYLPWNNVPFIIYARPDKDKILGFEDGREQMEGVIENGKELLAAYDNLYFKLLSEGNKYFITTYNFEYESPESMLEAYFSFKEFAYSNFSSLNVKEVASHLVSTTKALISLHDSVKPELEDLKGTLLATHANLASFANMWKAVAAQDVKFTEDSRKLLLNTHMELIKFESRINKDLRELL